MARNENPPAAMPEDEQVSAEVALINDRALLAQFAEMAGLIPAEAGNGTENILRQILSATTWDQLDDSWDTSSIEDVLGKPLKLVSAVRRPSSYQGGLGVFLVLHLVDLKTGEKLVKTTGSISVVGQVARAYAIGAMPLKVQWMRAERPSENGYYPQHLKVLDTFAVTESANA